jgi:hypothetical protein
MYFDLPQELQKVRERTRRFIRDEIVPMEADPRQTAHGPQNALRSDLVARRVRLVQDRQRDRGSADRLVRSVAAEPRIDIASLTTKVDMRP